MSNAAKSALRAAGARAGTLARSPTSRRWGLRLAIFLLIVGLLGFFAAPPLIRSLAERQLSALLMRPVTIQRIALNPYTLTLEADGLRIAERNDGGAPPGDFVTLGRLRVRPSWSSMFRLKPIIAEVLIDTLHVNLVRSAPQVFNFSDIVDALARPSAEPAPPPSKPLLFSVSNIRVENTRIDFDDRVLNEHHSLAGLRIGLPFIANIPSKVEVFVQPLLEARIDDSPFSMAGKVKPFSATLASSIDIRLDQLALPALLAYSPVALPVTLQKAQLSTNLHVQFERVGEQPKVDVSGTLDLAELSITGSDGQPLFDADRIHIAADSIEPLKPLVHLSELRVEHPVLSVSRDTQGELNLARLAARPAAPPAAASAPKPARRSGPRTQPADTTPASSPAALPEFVLRNFRLDRGLVRFEDHAAGTGGASYQIDPLEIDITDLATLATAPATVRLRAHLAQGGDIAFESSVVVPERAAEGRLSVDALALPVFQPYLAPLLSARLAGGTLGLQMQAKINARDAAAPAILIGPGDISLQALKLVGDRKRIAAVELGSLKLQIGLIDLAAHRAGLSSIDIERLGLSAERAADGSIDLAQWLKAGKSATTPAATPTNSAPWHYKVDRVALSQSSLNFSDLANAAPVALKLSDLAMKVENVSDDEHGAMPLEASGTLQKKGHFAVRGSVTREPLQATLNLKATALDVAAVSPYFASGINASIASALLNLAGDATLARSNGVIKAGYKGDVSLGNFRLLDKETSEPFAGFRDLSLSKIRLAYDDHGPDVDIGRIALSDFFAQVLLDAGGKLNVGQVMVSQVPPPAALAAGTTSPTPSAVAATAAPAVTGSATAPAAAASPPLKLHIGEIALAGGNVDYTDNFIKPNFRANLTDFGGHIGSFGSATQDAAPVELNARLNSSGPVHISGTMNPLAPSPALDISATASEIELTRFAAYSTKYTGYPIVKGKLQVDLHYALKDNQLNANNHIFIDQFTFGEHVDSPTATSLPVRLAISLLKNSRGEIDINVPVSGSLSDPQFSVGGLIWHAFLNLLEKAVTSPFSLLASAFGGSGADQLGSIDFAPGSALLADAQKSRLEKLAKALGDRPALKLDLAGHVDPALDAPALKQASVERQIKLQKIRDIVGKGESIDVDNVSIAPDEYEKYLTQAYKAADLKKPRNAIGLAKSLPPEEMRALLANNASANEADLRALAERRAAVVEQWLAGKLDAGRIFVVAPVLEASAGKEGGATTRVDFTLKD